MTFLFRKRSTENNSCALSGESDGAKQTLGESSDVSALTIDLTNACAAVPDNPPSNVDFEREDNLKTSVFSGLYILLAEDDEFIGDLLREELSSYGARIQHVLDGKAACLAALGSERPSIILMDCQMPIMDGFEAAIYIRTEENRNGLPAVPIIALTALDREFDRHHSQKAGIDAYLTKPVYGYQISHAIDKILKKKLGL